MDSDSYPATSADSFIEISGNTLVINGLTQTLD